MSPARALDAGERLRRLFAILAYLARLGEAPIDELAQRFGIERDVLVAELELAACCGLPPYTPDQLLELVVEDDFVRAYGLEALRRGARLTPDEGFALAAAARALLAVPGADAAPLEGALAKLEAALGEDRLVVELEVPPRTLELQRLAARGRCVAIEYLGAHRGEETERVVEPFAVVTREGHYYLDAYCRLARDWRRFRIDRIADLTELDEAVVPRTMPAALAGERAFTGGQGARSVRISVPVAMAALLERFATTPAELDGARALVTIEVVDESFLGRLLLSLGEEATVLDPPELAHAARTVARRALRRYGEHARPAPARPSRR